MAKAVKEAVEIERQERIKTLQEMADGRQDSTYAVANTNENLARVHKELKKLFHHIEVCYNLQRQLLSSATSHNVICFCQGKKTEKSNLPSLFTSDHVYMVLGG